MPLIFFCWNFLLFQWDLIQMEDLLGYDSVFWFAITYSPYSTSPRSWSKRWVLEECTQCWIWDKTAQHPHFDIMAKGTTREEDKYTKSIWAREYQERKVELRKNLGIRNILMTTVHHLSQLCAAKKKKKAHLGYVSTSNFSEYDNKWQFWSMSHQLLPCLIPLLKREWDHWSLFSVQVSEKKVIIFQHIQQTSARRFSLWRNKFIMSFHFTLLVDCFETESPPPSQNAIEYLIGKALSPVLTPHTKRNK